MRITLANTAAVLTTAAVTLLAGCSGGSSPASLPLAGSNSGASSLDRAGASQQRFGSSDRSGIAPKFIGKLHAVLPLANQLLPMNSPYKLLAVSDFGTGAVEVLGPAFLTKYTVTTGLNGPDGDWIDAAKNLYVANYTGVNVQEYASGSSSPTFTYSAGLSDPINVTTDTKGNVYVADYSADAVVEYAQGVNTVVAQCTLGGGVEGIAVDSSGNVFAAYNNASTGVGNIVEYTGGLAGCAGTTLTPTLGFAGGIQIANDGTLVAADQFVGVDLIPKPYTAIASTITGAADPFHISLTKFNHLLFIADPANADVLVVHYPSGSSYLTLGAANGLSDPAGVAAYEVGTN